MSTSNMHTTKTSFEKVEKMGCYLKETENHRSYLLAACTKKDHSLESLKMGSDLKETKNCWLGKGDKKFFSNLFPAFPLNFVSYQN